MVVLFDGAVARAPPIGFELADQVVAARKDLDAPFGEVLLYPCDAAPQLLVDPRVDRDAVLEKEFCDALAARQRALTGGAVDERVQSAVAPPLPIQLVGKVEYLVRVIADLSARLVPLADDIDDAVPIDREKQAREGVAKPRVDRDVLLPLLWEVERLDDVARGVEFAVDSPLRHRESAVPSHRKFALVKARRHALYLPLVEKGIVAPLDVLVPHLGIAAAVHVDLVIDPRQTLERRHRPPDFAALVEDAHLAFAVDVERRLFVEPDKVERRALKLFAPLVAALERDLGQPAEHVFDQHVVDYPSRRRLFPTRRHHDLLYPIGVEIAQDLCLRDVALHLVRQRHHPPFHSVSVGAIGMYPSRPPHRLDRAALRLAAAVAAEHPPVAFEAAVKSHLLLVHLFALVVAFERAVAIPPLLLRLYVEDVGEQLQFALF